MSQLIPVSEIYGPVCQGEGPLAGRPTVFLRLGGCDYHCSWCDSLYAVEPKYVKDWTRMSAHDIVQSVTALVPIPSPPWGHVTISGGNPLIHDLTDLLVKFGQSRTLIAIETQGTIYHEFAATMVDTLVLSPKPPSSGNVTDPDHGPLHRFINMRHHDPRLQTALKVVIDLLDDRDVRYAREIRKRFPMTPMWLQAMTDVGKDSPSDLIDKLDVLQELILNDSILYSCQASIQQHVLIHGHKRGI